MNSTVIIITVTVIRIFFLFLLKFVFIDCFKKCKSINSNTFIIPNTLKIDPSCKLTISSKDLKSSLFNYKNYLI